MTPDPSIARTSNGWPRQPLEVAQVKCLEF